MNLSNESAVSGAIATQGMSQTPSLYQNQTSLHQINRQTIQQFNPYTRQTQTQTQIKPTYYSKSNIPSCSNQDGGPRGDGFSWYIDEDISESEQQEREKEPSGKLKP
jgi:hypothetical protein